jgi:flagellar biosynthesis GTPase FlhF
MPDISELDDTAQLMRVSWRKARNYYASLARTFFEAQDKFAATDYGLDPWGKPWTFRLWVALKAGLSVEQLLQQFRIFKSAIAAEERQRAEAERQRGAAEKRAAKQAATDQARQAREERARQREQEEAARAAVQREREEAQRQARATKTRKAKNKTKNDQQRTRREDRRRQLANQPPENATLRELLEQARRVEKQSHVDLGKLYSAMRREVQAGRAGNDENGRPWTWLKWAKVYIQHPKSTIHRYITIYTQSLGNVPNRDVPHGENVVQFR